MGCWPAARKPRCATPRRFLSTRSMLLNLLQALIFLINEITGTQAYNAVMITDTAFYRNRNYHTAGDTAEKLDYKRMAMVVEGVYATVSELARF